MLFNSSLLHVLRDLPTDGRLLFATRSARLFGYGLYSVALVLNLRSLELDNAQIGVLLSLTLLGDTVISLGLTTQADRVGRKTMLFIGALLMLFAGVVFVFSDNFWLLLFAATVGVISPSGNEVGPFLSIEQAALAQTLPADKRTDVFAWYNLVGTLAAAFGALSGGFITKWAENLGAAGPDSYRPLAVIYSVIGLLLAIAFTRLSPAVDVAVRAAHSTAPMPKTRLGLHHSLPVVLKLSALFALDAFGGGFVLQSVVADWFYQKFHVEVEILGAIFFGANILAAFSALAASSVARRIGLVNTIVFTHLPSNILLILVPLMPELWMAVAILFLRFSISQMDVPTRQSYTMAIVRPDERSAAAGVTGIARSLGASISPLLAPVLVGSVPFFNLPFFLAGGCKIIYDLLLYRSFVAIVPPGEKGT